MNNYAYLVKVHTQMVRLIAMSATDLKEINNVVVKLSGSIFPANIDKSDLQPFVKTFSDLRNRDVRLVLVAGGGKNARHYITAARLMGADESTLDEVGIIVSRLNAMLLIAGLGRLVYSSVPTTLKEVSQAFEEKGLVVTGGLHPGQSTNATACLIAERVRADLFLNCTSVNGVYTEDPKLSKEAKILHKVTIKQLKEILSSSPLGAGTYELMDRVALEIIERSKIPSRIVLCTPENIKKAIEGSNIGTLLISN